MDNVEFLRKFRETETFLRHLALAEGYHGSNSFMDLLNYLEENKKLTPSEIKSFRLMLKKRNEIISGAFEDRDE